MLVEIGSRKVEGEKNKQRVLPRMRQANQQVCLALFFFFVCKVKELGIVNFVSSFGCFSS